MSEVKPKLDATDRAIIMELQADARRPYKTIAQKLGVSEGTVKNRVTRMTSRGILKLEARVNPCAMPNHVAAMVGVTLKNRSHRETMAEIEQTPGVTSVWNASGRYDLFFEIMVDSIDELHEFLFERCLGRIEGIESTESFILLSSNTKYFKLS
jgi:Lrp/AsnC family transcriptional regulator for asnA, asnC and gidA